MNFTFTKEQQRFREEVRDFCQTTPYGKIDARISIYFSPEFYRKYAAKGWRGLTIPKEYGGQGRSMVEETIFAEELSCHRAPIALVEYFTHVDLFGRIILEHGSEQQKRFYLPRIARGEIWLGQSFTESGGGSDLLATATRAVRQGDHYIINGEKMFNTFAHRIQYEREYGIRKHVLLLARTDQSAPSDKSLSLFIFDATEPLPGMGIYPIMTMGDRTNEIFFDNVRIPAESLLGEENHAWDYIVEKGSFYWARYRGYFGTAKGLLQELVQYVRETKVNGKPLSENMLIRHKLAELAIQIEEVRLLDYRFAWAVDKGLDFMGLAALAKLNTDRLARNFANLAMQILGPYAQLEGGSKYAPFNGAIESMYKAGIIRLFGSTGPSAMLNIIAGHVLGLPNEFGLIY